MSAECRTDDRRGYRPDVDGLRAFAVVAVILFHAKVPGAGGGYVGVDVFFVISGFLITRWLLTRESQPLAAQLREFYARRARRILPAFVLVAAVTTLMASWLLLRAHIEIYGRFLAASSLMLANVGAYSRGNYFGWTANDMPLLHLWSIAVEEQFYLFYPLAFIALAFWSPRARTGSIAAGAALSFALCLWAVSHHPVANYYSLPTRAWELMLGALLALGALRVPARRAVREVLAALALVALVASVTLLNPAAPFPGALTLIPCVATVALIGVGSAGGSYVTSLLSARALVFTGLISYSLYLWHLPVLGLYSYYNIFALRPLEVLVLCALIYLLATASWRWIEQPFRRRAWLPRDRSFWGSAVAVSLALCVTGLALAKFNDLPRRLAEAAERSPGVDVRMRQRAAQCMVRDLAQIRRGDLCRFGPGEEDVTASVLVWGDSHSWALVPLYQRLAEDHRLALYIAQFPNCGPLVGAVGDARCVDFNDAMLGAVRALHPDLIVLNSRWDNPRLRLVESASLTIRGSESLFSRGLQETIERVRTPGRRICVVKNVPTIRYNGEYALAMARRRGIDPGFLALSRADAFAGTSEQDAAIDDLAHRGQIRAVDPKSVLCMDVQCLYLARDGSSIYMDDNHVSIAGAELLYDEVARCFADVVAAN